MKMTAQRKALVAILAVGAAGLVVDRIMLGSDYPFPIGDPEPRRVIEMAGFDALSRKAMLGEVAMRLFKLG